MAAAASLAGAFFVHRAGRAGALKHGEEACETLLIASATVWFVVTATIEIDAFVPMRLVLAVALAAASAVALLYAALGRRFDWPAIAWTALAHAPIVFSPPRSTRHCSPIRSPTAAGGPGRSPFAAHAVVLRLAAPFWPKLAAHAMHALGAITLALVGALLGRVGDGAVGRLRERLAVARLAGRAGGDAAAPAAAGDGARLAGADAARGVPDSAAAVLAAGLWVWTLVANVASDGSAAPLPYLPFLNPLDIGIGIALAATLLWLKQSTASRPGRWRWRPGAGFVWLNAILVRSFHHYAGVPYHFDAWLDSLAVQTGITLLWTAIALATMWLASTRSRASPGSSARPCSRRSC